MSLAQRAGKLKALVFDLDDTLYSQADYKRSGFRAVADWLEKQQGLNPEHTYAQLENILRSKGASYPRMFDDFVSQQQLPPALAKSLIEVFINHPPQLQCYAGVDSLLQKLGREYRLGILTDGRQSSQEKKLAALNLPDRVDAILCSDSLGLSKPAAKLFQWFEERFQLQGEQLAYIGDNPDKDFFGANRRDWLTIRVLTGEHRQKNAQNDYQAHYELARVTDLAAWLKLPQTSLAKGQ